LIVTGWGGKTKIFELQGRRQQIDGLWPDLPQVLQTLNNSNIKCRRNTLNIGSQSA